MLNVYYCMSHIYLYLSLTDSQKYTKPHSLSGCHYILTKKGHNTAYVTSMSLDSQLRSCQQKIASQLESFSLTWLKYDFINVHECLSVVTTGLCRCHEALLITQSCKVSDYVSRLLVGWLNKKSRGHWCVLA